MAATTYVSDLGRHVGETVRVSGWLYNKRSSGKLQFLILRDGTVLEDNVVAWVVSQVQVTDEPVKFDELMGRAA